MSAKRASWASVCVSLAHMILKTRKLRRRMLLQLLVVLLLLVLIGAWPLAAWLEQNLGFFMLWWGLTGLYGLMVILLALYDMLAVIREERDRL